MMYSFEPGFGGSLVEVKAAYRKGIPAVDIVGMRDGMVKDMLERVRGAVEKSGLQLCPERVLIALRPADVAKESANHDLSIALCMMNVADGGKKCLALGPLDADGRVRRAVGVYAALVLAKEGGITRAIIPEENARDADGVEGMRIAMVSTLRQAKKAYEDSCFGEISTEEEDCGDDEVRFPPLPDGIREADALLPELPASAIEAMVFAAAGRHSMLAIGAPGCGKTLLMQAAPLITPLLTRWQAEETRRIYSLANMDACIKDGRTPFRQPHQTATIEGMCSGGARCSPGEMSLAHNGALFLDEAAEFRTSVLQMLRVPLESHRMTLARAGKSVTYPADFQLLMTVNSCPCGNFGSGESVCLCSARAIKLYWNKFSAPLLDRIEIVYDFNRHQREERSQMTCGEARKLVARAVRAQRKRGTWNSRLELSGVTDAMDRGARLAAGGAEKRLSPRAFAGVCRVARTAADIGGSPAVRACDVSRALDLRERTPLDRLNGEEA